MSELKLKPCPWCKMVPYEPPVFDKNAGGGYTRRWTQRCRCGVVGPAARTRQEAVVAWNTRLVEDKMYEALKEVLAHLPNTEIIDALKADAGLGYRLMPMDPAPTDAEVAKWIAVITKTEVSQ